MTRPYTGKKEPTDPVKKEQHQDRKSKKEILHTLEVVDWEQQLQEFIHELPRVEKS